MGFYFLEYVTTDAWYYAIARRLWGFGCRLLAVHVSSPCTATSARTLLHVVYSSQRTARSVWSLTSHCQDTGASGRRVSFKLGGAPPSGVKARGPK